MFYFFAQTRELIGVDSIQLEGDFATAEAVREHLGSKKVIDGR